MPREGLRFAGLIPQRDELLLELEEEAPRTVHREFWWQSVQVLGYLPGHSPEKDGIRPAVKTECNSEQERGVEQLNILLEDSGLLSCWKQCSTGKERGASPGFCWRGTT